MIAIKQQLSSMKPIQLADINALVTDFSALTTLAEAIHYSKADEYTDIKDGYTYRTAIETEGIYVLDHFVADDQHYWTVDYGDTNSGGLNLTNVNPFDPVNIIKHQILAEIYPIYYRIVQCELDCRKSSNLTHL